MMKKECKHHGINLNGEKLAKPAKLTIFSNARSDNAGLFPTMNQLKLCIAMELKSEGFSTVVFDKLLEVYDRRIKVHVYGEDELGLRIAVYCVNRPCHVKPNEILDIVNLIRSGIEDCDVALAFPLVMLDRAKVLIGLTSKVYMIDDDGKVWVHHLWNIMHEDPILPALSSAHYQVDEDSEIHIREASQVRLHYVV
ncbi:MAG: hypothetical protein RMJ15_11000 [Nitrososphaerota archaeon]|nr:hypothetical protein [Nitrososphaerota archaeon]